MDEDLQQLEAELTRLRPATLRRELFARVEAQLAIPVRRPRPLWWLWATALPIAAAFAVVFVVSIRNSPAPGNETASAVARPAAPAGAAAFKPVAAENVLYAAEDEGFVTLEDGTSARRERLDYVDTITWKNPRTNASVRWTVPREEVRVIPVVFQ